MRALTKLTDTRFTRWLSSRCVLFIVALVGMAVLIASPELRITRPVKAATFSVCAVGCDFTTIQAAVTAADATPEDDIINVQAGTYSELVTIPATEPNLVINGANVNIHACTGTRVADPSSTATRALRHSLSMQTTSS